MGKQLPTIWKIDAHTVKKHEILRRYWEAWLPIMGTWNGRILFIDGFAGPGRYEGGEDGSPVVVLKAAIQHRYKVKAEVLFLFIEKDKDRCEHLRQVLKEMKPSLPGNFKYDCIEGSFDEEITKNLTELAQNKKKLAPALVFVDPFGFSHTPYETIAKLLQNPRCDVLINFMFEEINRFLALPEQPRNYDKLFGTDEWRKALAMPPGDRRKFLHDLYLAQLRKVAKYVRSFEMVNKGNATDYFLFFASNSLRGLEKMKEAMWRADSTGEYSFSDYTDARGLQSLFADNPDFNQLRDLIVGRFREQQATIEQIHEFVVAETLFLGTHYKTKILKPLEAEGKLQVVSAPPKRKRGTFPTGTTVRFL
ncbi:MAG: three-Cys-motif partner protein TcmP [Acidobacteriota bacterium]|nr:three-Cys-motif partner protein TcmP [Acidobacteriota bacterium]